MTRDAETSTWPPDRRSSMPDEQAAGPCNLPSSVCPPQSDAPRASSNAAAKTGSRDDRRGRFDRRRRRAFRASLADRADDVTVGFSRLDTRIRKTGLPDGRGRDELEIRRPPPDCDRPDNRPPQPAADATPNGSSTNRKPLSSLPAPAAVAVPERSRRHTPVCCAERPAPGPARNAAGRAEPADRRTETAESAPAACSHPA